MCMLSKVITTFVLYMLLCIPALAAQTVGGYVSNTPMAAGPNASLGEVWMRHGGARLQYDALMGSVQTNTNGVLRRDPASIKTLPPIPVQKSTRYKYVRPKKKVSTAKKTTSTKKVLPKSNMTHKPVVNDKKVIGPYSGVAPQVPAAAPVKEPPSPPPAPKATGANSADAAVVVVSPNNSASTIQ